MKVRNTKFQMIKGAKLDPHPQNWRIHPKSQVQAFRSIVDKLGFVGAIVVRPGTKRGRYEILDGHLRVGLADAAEYPCIVTDLNDREAKLFLTTADNIGMMATTNIDALKEALAGVGKRLQGAINDDVPNVGAAMLEQMQRLSDAEDELKAPVWAADVDKFLEDHGEAQDQDERRKHAWVTIDFGKHMDFKKALAAERRTLKVLGEGRGRSLDPKKFLKALKLYEAKYG